MTLLATILLTRIFVPDRLFHHSLKYVGKTRSLPKGVAPEMCSLIGKSMALLRNI